MSSRTSDSSASSRLNKWVYVATTIAQEFTVGLVAKSPTNAFYGVGDVNTFLIGEDESPVLNVTEGQTYAFISRRLPADYAMFIGLDPVGGGSRKRCWRSRPSSSGQRRLDVDCSDTVGIEKRQRNSHSLLSSSRARKRRQHYQDRADCAVLIIKSAMNGHDCDDLSANCWNEMSAVAPLSSYVGASSSASAGSPSRLIIQGDALEYLHSVFVLSGNVVTSLPDVSEITSMSLSEWRSWFLATVALILSKLPREGVAVFYSTDVRDRVTGEWISKAQLILGGGATDIAGVKLLWHKIVLTPAATTLRKGGKASYSHLIAFGKHFTIDRTAVYTDVLPVRGAMLWNRGTGLGACAFAIEFIRKHSPHRTIIDPFNGVGSVTAVANALGLNAIGVERSKKRCALATTLDVSTIDWNNDDMSAHRRRQQIAQLQQSDRDRQEQAKTAKSAVISSEQL